MPWSRNWDRGQQRGVISGHWPWIKACWTTVIAWVNCHPLLQAFLTIYELEREMSLVVNVMEWLKQYSRSPQLLINYKHLHSVLKTCNLITRHWKSIWFRPLAPSLSTVNKDCIRKKIKYLWHEFYDFPKFYSYLLHLLSHLFTPSVM